MPNRSFVKQSQKKIFINNLTQRLTHNIIINKDNSLINIKSINQFHPHHLTANSPWPILTAFSTLSFLVGAVLWFNDINHGGFLITIGIITVIASFTLWFRDIITEGVYLGHHTRIVQNSLSIGVTLFIVTEVFFFVSIFWAYLHSALSPTVELGIWPPIGITPINPITVPLLNTILLVSSGATVTWAHHSLIWGYRESSINGTLFTVVLAILFTALQVFEYITAGFTIADGAYGSTFFFGTGFHGFHILIGTIFIIVGIIRIFIYHFTWEHHVGYESSILYWHFVDVVWLVLYILFYWWGS